MFERLFEWACVTGMCICVAYAALSWVAVVARMIGG